MTEPTLFDTGQPESSSFSVENLDVEYVFVPVPSGYVPTKSGPQPAIVQYKSKWIDANGLDQALNECAASGTPVYQVFKEDTAEAPGYRVVAVAHVVPQPKPKLVQPATAIPNGPLRIVRDED